MGNLDKDLHDLFNPQAVQQKKSAPKGKDCLSELVIHRYLEKKTDPKERERVEKHLLECYDCLQIMADASKAKGMFEKGEFKSFSGSLWTPRLKKELPPQKNLASRRKSWGWLAAAIISFLCSFFFRRYFIQFSVATLFFGIKWIVETRTTKVLIAIRDAWRRGDQQSAEELLEKLGKLK